MSQTICSVSFSTSKSLSHQIIIEKVKEPLVSLDVEVGLCSNLGMAPCEAPNIYLHVDMPFAYKRHWKS